MDDFTTRPGTVVSAEPGRIVVRVEREAEEGCDGCRVCAMKSLCRGRDEGHMDLPVPVGRGAAFHPGERVCLEYRLPGQAAAAAIMFIPALVGLLLGGLAAVRWTGGGDALLVLFCLCGLAGGVGATFLIARFGRSLRPEVRLVDSANPPQAL